MSSERERNPNKNVGREIEKKSIYFFDLVPNANGVYVVGRSDPVFRAFNTTILKWLLIP